MPDTSTPLGPRGETTLRLGILDADAPATDPSVLRAAERSSRIEIVAVAADSGPPERYGTVAKRSPGAVIDDPRVDAVYVATVGSDRSAWVEQAARAGKHVLCEPPIATSVADAAAMHAACTRADVLLGIADAVGFHPRTAAIEDFVRDGSIGDVRAVTSEHSAPDRSGSHAPGRHAALWRLGVDVLPPILAVLPDAVVDTVTASPSTATTVVHLTAPGAAALALCSLELVARQELVFRGTDGTVAVERPFDPRPEDTAFLVRRPTGTVEEIHTGGTDPHLAMLETFAAACSGEVEWPTDQDASMRLIGKLAETVASLPAPDTARGRPT